MKKAVVVHPSNDTIGCGGTLLWQEPEGDELHWVLCASVCEKEGHSKEPLTICTTKIKECAGLVWFDGVHQIGLRTIRVDECDAFADCPFLASSQRNRIEGHFLPFQIDGHSESDFAALPIRRGQHIRMQLRCTAG